MKHAASRAWSLILLLTVLLGAGCATTPPRPAPVLVTGEEIALLPPSVQTWVQRLESQGERNAVMNLTELASAALRVEDHIPAHLRKLVIDQALDEAMMRIEAVYADTPEARQARSVWHSEAKKDFKGEPYERCWVYLLRGIRYYGQGDLQNARACFMSGSLQDSLSEEGEYNADMPVFEYLIALCEARLNRPDHAKEAWERAHRLGAEGPPPSADANVLVFVMAGESPEKVQAGNHDEIMLIAPGELYTRQIALQAPWRGEATPRVAPAVTEDFYFQATTRGGRAIDEINKRKAMIKGTTSTVGDVAIAGGFITMMASRNHHDSTAGLVIMLAGVVIKIVGNLMRSEADIRQINAMPSRVFVWSGRLDPGRHTLTATCRGPDLTKTVARIVEVADHGHSVAILQVP